MKRLPSLFILIVFCFSTLCSYPTFALTAPAELVLPPTGKLLPLSSARPYTVLRGMRINPNDPMKFEFVIDKPKDKAVDKEEFRRLVSYFMAALTIPEQDFWVNLSPYEQDRVIPDAVAGTDFGRDLLAQDYVLKQVAASITYPETALGKAYWDKVYSEAAKAGLSRNQAINAFSKVWIVPENVEIFEDGTLALVGNAKLKVLSESDYTAMNSSSQIATPREASARNDAADKILKEMVIPALTKEVNTGSNFTQLRQMFHSFALALWFKNKLKDSFFKYYINQNKTKGIDLSDKTIKDKIYNQYVAAFKTGVYNMIKKESVGANNHSPAQKITKRQYFSGGVNVYVPGAYTKEFLRDPSGQIKLNLPLELIGKLAEVAPDKEKEELAHHADVLAHFNEMHWDISRVTQALLHELFVAHKLSDGKNVAKVKKAAEALIVAGYGTRTDSKIPLAMAEELARVDILGSRLGIALKVGAGLVAGLVMVDCSGLGVRPKGADASVPVDTKTPITMVDGSSVDTGVLPAPDGGLFGDIPPADVKPNTDLELPKGLDSSNGDGGNGKPPASNHDNQDLNINYASQLSSNLVEGVTKYGIPAGYYGDPSTTYDAIFYFETVASKTQPGVDPMTPEEKAWLIKYFITTSGAYNADGTRSDSGAMGGCAHDWAAQFLLINGIVALRALRANPDNPTLVSAMATTAVRAMVKTSADFTAAITALGNPDDTTKQIAAHNYRSYALIAAHLLSLSGLNWDEFVNKFPNIVSGSTEDIRLQALALAKIQLESPTPITSEQAYDVYLLAKQNRTAFFAANSSADVIDPLVVAYDAMVILQIRQTEPGVNDFSWIPERLEYMGSFALTGIEAYFANLYAAGTIAAIPPMFTTMAIAGIHNGLHVVGQTMVGAAAMANELAHSTPAQASVDGGSAKKSGKVHEDITFEERMRIIGLAQGKMPSVDVKLTDSAIIKAVKVEDPAMSPNKRGTHINNAGLPVIALRQGLTPEMETYVVGHESSEIALDHTSVARISAVTSEFSAKDDSVSYRRVLHMIVAAQERAQWVKDGNEGLMPVDDEDLRSYDQVEQLNLSKEERALQRSIIERFYGKDSDVVRDSGVYETRYQEAAATYGGVNLAKTQVKSRMVGAPVKFNVSQQVVNELKNAKSVGFDILAVGEPFVLR